MQHYSLAVFPYPFSNFAVEFGILCALAACEGLRFFFSWKGNLTEQAMTMVLALVLMIPGVLGVTFYLIWQVRTKLFVIMSI